MLWHRVVDARTGRTQLSCKRTLRDLTQFLTSRSQKATQQRQLRLHAQNGRTTPETKQKRLISRLRMTDDLGKAKPKKRSALYGVLFCTDHSLPRVTTENSSRDCGARPTRDRVDRHRQRVWGLKIKKRNNPLTSLWPPRSRPLSVPFASRRTIRSGS